MQDKIVKQEKQPNGQIKVWVEFVGLRPKFIGIGNDEKAAFEDAKHRAKATVDSL